MTDSELLEQLLSEMKSLKAGQVKLEEGLAKLEGGLAKLEGGQTKLVDGQAKLDDELARLENGLRETKIVMENTLNRQIKLIAEGHGIIIGELGKLEDYFETKERVATLEGSVKLVADRVKKLEKAAV